MNKHTLLFTGILAAVLIVVAVVLFTLKQQSDMMPQPIPVVSTNTILNQAQVNSELDSLDAAISGIDMTYLDADLDF